MFSLNVPNLRFSELMGMEERWEVLSQEELSRLKGGADPPYCPPMCTCDIDCQMYGCVPYCPKDYCDKFYEEFCPGDDFCWDMQCMADT